MIARIKSVCYNIFVLNGGIKVVKLNFSSDDAGTKLILLYTLEQMEIPLNEHFIFDICTSRNDWINYMECKMAPSCGAS